MTTQFYVLVGTFFFKLREDSFPALVLTAFVYFSESGRWEMQTEIVVASVAGVDMFVILQVW